MTADLFGYEAAEEEPTAQARNEHFKTMTEDNWGTPPEVVVAVHRLFGCQPDLDPASDAFRNKTVRARRWLGLEHVSPTMGIPTDWGKPHFIFCNPPGGKFGNATLAQIFWSYATDFVERGSFLVWVAYNINQLQNLQTANARALAASWVCVPSRRLNFRDLEGKASNSPTQANAILMVAPSEKRAMWGPRFVEAFNDIGVCWAPRDCLPLRELDDRDWEMNALRAGYSGMVEDRKHLAKEIGWYHQENRRLREALEALQPADEGAEDA